MPDEVIPPVPVPGATPAAAVAAPPPPPPPAAAPAAPAAPATGAPVLHVPQDKFKERVERRAEQRIKDALGISLEEAKKLIRRQKRRGDGAPIAVPATAEERETNRVDRLTEKNRILRQQKEEADRQLKRVKQRSRDKVVEMALRHSALSVGISEEHTDFVLAEFAKKMQDAAFVAAGADDRAFFAGLRTKQPYLFRDGIPAPAPTTVPVGASSAPPESIVPGGGPNEGTPPAPAAPVIVDDMTPAEFRAHQRRVHNYGG